jgi:hypothetical protein
MKFIFSGGLGQLGTGLAKLMRKQFGRENVILSDIIRPSKEILDNGKIFVGVGENLNFILLWISYFTIIFPIIWKIQEVKT